MVLVPPPNSSGSSGSSRFQSSTLLLGQYNAFERVDVDSSDLYASSSLLSSPLPFPDNTKNLRTRRIAAVDTLGLLPTMEFHHEYLWIRAVDDDAPTVPKNGSGPSPNDGVTNAAAAAAEALETEDLYRLPLLASTEKLLSLLQEPLPERRLLDREENDDDTVGVVVRNESAAKEEDEGVAATAHGNVTQRTTTITSKKGLNGNDTKTNTTTDINNSNAPYQKLIRVQNLTDAIFAALWDIYSMKSDFKTASSSLGGSGTAPTSIGSRNNANAKKGKNNEKTGKRTGRGFFSSRDQSRTMALEKQRERLQAQQQRHQKDTQQEKQQQLMSCSTTTSTESTNVDTLSEIEEEGNANDDCGAVAPEDQSTISTRSIDYAAWMALAAILNSLRVLTPILLDICFHERRNDATLSIQGSGIQKSTKRSQGGGGARRRGESTCWLLGKRAYDTSPVGKCKTVLEKLMDLYLFFGVASESMSSATTKVQGNSERNASLLSMYKVALSRNMLQLVAGFDTSSRGPSPSTTVAWSTQHPFEEMDKTDQLKLAAATAILDEKFGLLEKSSSLDAKKHASYLNSIQGLHSHLQSLLSRRFPKSRLSLYGSCLSDLSLGKDADVDLSLHMDSFASVKQSFELGSLSVADYQKEVRRVVFNTCRHLESRKAEFCDMTPVTNARVPVCKGTYLTAGNPYTRNGSIDFDICFLNDIAVANSELVREYSLVDPRAKSLMVTVKHWAKQHGLSSTQNNCLSSYAWMNLVIFYMQSLGLVPNLQCPTLMKRVGVIPDPQNNYWHSVNNLDTCSLTWIQASTVWSAPAQLQHLSVTALLYGFFHFYAKQFPTAMFCVSVKIGGGISIPQPKTSFRKSTLFWCIEDPFETVFSHCPHDLGLPTNVPSTRLIIECIHSAEVHLRKVLLDLLDDCNGSNTIDTLWPDPVANKSSIVTTATSTNEKGPEKRSGIPTPPRQNNTSSKQPPATRNGMSQPQNHNEKTATTNDDVETTTAADSRSMSLKRPIEPEHEKDATIALLAAVTDVEKPAPIPSIGVANDKNDSLDVAEGRNIKNNVVSSTDAKSNRRNRRKGMTRHLPNTTNQQPPFSASSVNGASSSNSAPYLPSVAVKPLTEDISATMDAPLVANPKVTRNSAAGPIQPSLVLSHPKTILAEEAASPVKSRNRRKGKTPPLPNSTESLLPCSASTPSGANPPSSTSSSVKPKPVSVEGPVTVDAFLIAKSDEAHKPAAGPMQSSLETSQQTTSQTEDASSATTGSKDQNSTAAKKKRRSSRRSPKRNIQPPKYTGEENGK